MTIGKTKNTTNDLIEDAIDRQNAWQKNRRHFTRKFLRSLDTFAKRKDGTTSTKKTNHSYDTIKEYWFPILCAFIVLFIALFVICVRVYRHTHNANNTAQNIVPEPVIQQVEVTTPTFDIVRIENGGALVVAGRWKPNTVISVYINGKLVASEQTDDNGEFVYAPQKPLSAGNYTLYLVGTSPETKSENKVFLYVSNQGTENSVSLLMTKNGSTLMQKPTTLADGDLVISKIDYLSNGRLVVTGDGLPRLRVSLDLDGKYIGFARVSDHKHFGLGADTGELKPGQDYVMTVRLHDGDGNTISTVKHQFTMPQMTGDDDTFYTVRRGDCLWIIARNFMRRGVLFSMIAQRNNIENPDLIFPKQKLEIPVQGK